MIYIYISGRDLLFSTTQSSVSLLQEHHTFFKKIEFASIYHDRGRQHFKKQVTPKRFNHGYYELGMDQMTAPVLNGLNGLLNVMPVIIKKQKVCMIASFPKNLTDIYISSNLIFCIGCYSTSVTCRRTNHKLCNPFGHEGSHDPFVSSKLTMGVLFFSFD